MTKRRPPLSVAAALARIAGQIPGDYTTMGKLLDRSPGLIYAWGNPDRRERMPIDDAIALDLAYGSAGGEGLPIYEAYGAMLQAESTQIFADGIALGRQVATLIKECSDAEAAVVIAAQPGSTPHDRAVAVHDLETAMTSVARTRSMLTGNVVPGANETPAINGAAGSDLHQTGPPR